MSETVLDPGVATAGAGPVNASAIANGPARRLAGSHAYSVDRVVEGAVGNVYSLLETLAEEQDHTAMLFRSWEELTGLPADLGVMADDLVDALDPAESEPLVRELLAARGDHRWTARRVIRRILVADGTPEAAALANALEQWEEGDERWLSDPVALAGCIGAVEQAVEGLLSSPSHILVDENPRFCQIIYRAILGPDVSDLAEPFLDELRKAEGRS